MDYTCNRLKFSSGGQIMGFWVDFPIGQVLFYLFISGILVPTHLKLESQILSLVDIDLIVLV